MRLRRLLLTALSTCVCALTLLAQSNEELILALDEAQTPRERYGILYQLTRNHTISGPYSDAEIAVDYGNEAYRTARQIGDKKLEAASAFALAQAYARERNDGKTEAWLKVATEAAKKTGNASLILKATAQRTRLASRRKRYRDAVQINEDALEYFTEDGNDIETLRARLEQEAAGLRRQQAAIEAESAQLAQELERLRGERDNLEGQNQNLKQQTELSSRQLAERARQLQETEAQKKEVEQRVAESRAQIKDLGREALEQRTLASQAKEELAQEALVRKEAELAAAEARTENLEQASRINYLVGGTLGVGLLALIFLVRARVKSRAATALAAKNAELDEARARSDELLVNILPADIAAELKETGKARARAFPEVTVLFCDFVDFTKISEQLTAEELVRELDTCFRAFDEIVDRYPGVEKIKTVGDAYLVASGLTDRKTLPGPIVEAALNMQAFLEEEANRRRARALPFFTGRIGLHTGPVAAGVVGARKFAYDIWGDTVNVASRIETSGAPGRVNVSETTYRAIKYDFVCEYRGKLAVKNKGELDMYFVLGRR